MEGKESDSIKEYVEFRLSRKVLEWLREWHGQDDGGTEDPGWLGSLGTHTTLEKTALEKRGGATPRV